MAINRERKITQRQINAIETKKKISKCAMELFEEHGFYNIRIEDIVEKAGIAKGSFYTHFKSKDQVVVEYYKNIDNYYEFIYNQFDDEIASYEKLMEILKAGFVYTERFGKELLSVVLINQISGKEDVPHVTNKNRKIYKIIQGIIKTKL